MQVGTAEMPCKVAASLLQACYLAVIRLILGCVCIAFSGLMITSLLQIELSRLFIHKLDASCFNKKSGIIKFHRSDFHRLDDDKFA